MQYNHAHEHLVSAFTGAEWIGGEEYGLWRKPLRNNWTRDNTCFGYILLMNGAKNGGKVKASYNLKDGKLWIQDIDKGDQLVYRMSEDEWWKIHYEGRIVSRLSSPC
jgi:hypothetical protein